MALLTKPKPKTLAERIKDLQADVDAYIDERARQEADKYDGNLSFEVCRALITSNGGCRCANALAELEKD